MKLNLTKTIQIPVVVLEPISSMLTKQRTLFSMPFNADIVTSILPRDMEMKQELVMLSRKLKMN